MSFQDAAFYGAKGDGAAVPNHDLYKAMRAEELGCYRRVVRALTMHHGPELPRPARRLLEDLQEELCIDGARHAMELADAAADPVVGSVQQSGVWRDRAPFYDGANDAPPEAAADETDDDGAAVQRPKPAAKRRAPKPVVPTVVVPSVSGFEAELRRIGAEVRKMGGALVYMPRGEERVRLQEQLSQKLSVLEELERRITAQSA